MKINNALKLVMGGGLFRIVNSKGFHVSKYNG